MTSIKVGASEGPGSVQPEQVAAKNATTMAIVRAVDIGTSLSGMGANQESIASRRSRLLVRAVREPLQRADDKGIKKIATQIGQPKLDGPDALTEFIRPRHARAA